MPKLTDLSGKQFGRWTVVSLAPRTNEIDIKWVCKCSCGTTKEVSAGSLRKGTSTSCGCYRKEIKSTNPLRKTPTYNSWDNMIGRCYRPSQPDYDSYGGRGIEVCSRWRESFNNFVTDMGVRPDGTSIDRKNVDGNYEPGNCQWSTNKEQQNNKRNSIRVPYNNELLTIEEVSNITGIPQTTIRNRISKGISSDRWLDNTNEIQKNIRNSIVLAYKTNPDRTLVSLAKEFNVSTVTVRTYLKAANA